MSLNAVKRIIDWKIFF